MQFIKIKNLTIQFGEKKVFDNFSIDFEVEKITGILGESGRGKTTLLNKIAEQENSVSFCFQEPRLIESISVLENVVLPLKNIFSKEEAYKKARYFLSEMNLSQKEKASPTKLSGGEKQRVALARALAFPSKILLLDEAFQSIDVQTKEKIISFMKDLLINEKRTTIFVTHNLEEAKYLCDKIVKI